MDDEQPAGRGEHLLAELAGLTDADGLQQALTRTVAIAALATDAGWASLAVLGPDATVAHTVDHGLEGTGGVDLRRAAAERAHQLARMAAPGKIRHDLDGVQHLVLPVRRGELVATLVVGVPGSGGFTQADEQVLGAVAASAGVILENARMRSWIAWREGWLEASSEITSTLAVGASETEVLQLVADRAREVAHCGVAWVLSGSDVDTLRLRVQSGGGTEMSVLSSLPLEDSFAREVIESAEPVRVEDLSGERRLARHATLPGWPRIGPAIMVPLAGADGVEGVLGLGWAPEDRASYDRLDASLPAAFAQQASLALRVGRAQHDQRQLAVLRDRDRIGRDLHDVVIQRLFAVGLGLASLARGESGERREKVDDAVDQIDEAIADIRRSIHALGRDGAEEDVQSLAAAIVDRATPALGFRAVLRLGGPLRTLTPPAVVPEVLAVLSEAMSNIVRHARATSARVELSVGGSQVLLRVTDDGCGIPQDSHESGLGNMRRRAEKLGGSFEVTSQVGAGTRLEWCVPLTV